MCYVKDSYREFSPAARPARLRAMAKGACIGNSLETALLYGVGYAEGIALHAEIRLWYRHAWNVNEHGEAVDVTWETPGTRYIGREWPVTQVIAQSETLKAYFFMDEIGPAVPEGGIGIDCYTQKERDWIEQSGFTR